MINYQVKENLDGCVWRAYRHLFSFFGFLYMQLIYTYIHLLFEKGNVVFLERA